MKYLIALFLFTPLFLASRDADAMVIKIDSVYADSCYQDGIYNVSSGDSLRMLHKPDGQLGQLTGNGPQIDLAFKKFKSKSIQVIKAGSTVLVWGKKDASVDSSAGQITFNKFDAGGTLVSSKPIILGDGINVVLTPNEDYVFVELSLASPVDQGSKNHAKSYFIDAIALVEDTATPTKSVPSQPLLAHSISSYPNPFISNTTIHFELESTGDVQLAVIDALGRETGRVDAGYLENGVHEIPLAIRTPGFYFVRLLVNGQPVGNPLKITSR